MKECAFIQAEPLAPYLHPLFYLHLLYSSWESWERLWFGLITTLIKRLKISRMAKIWNYQNSNCKTSLGMIACLHSTTFYFIWIVLSFNGQDSYWLFDYSPQVCHKDSRQFLARPNASQDGQLYIQSLLHENSR